MYSELPPPQQHNVTLRARATQILFASGPFTEPDNWKYEPLIDLLNKKQPNLLVLVRLSLFFSFVSGGERDEKEEREV
jgi:hypothetical protein